MKDKLKLELNNANDCNFRRITIGEYYLDVINIETITSSDFINNFILKSLSLLEPLENINVKNFLLNFLPGVNVTSIVSLDEAVQKLLNGFTVILINDQDMIAVETKGDLSRGISESDYEKSITGPKDAFNENFNTNIGLIRKRIKSKHLCIKNLELGTITKTRVGITYLKNVAKIELVEKVINKLNNIKIDGIIDSGYIKKYISKQNSFFPTVKATERPDLAAMSLLEGKVVIVVDNSPLVLIIPSFFIDYFHTNDDYYQKPINVTFIRLIRLIAFIIAIFLPAYYVAVTTHNPDAISLDLLINFTSQRMSVPLPSFLEATIMIVSFEILRESDMRIPSTMGSAVSILGGIVLGSAGVDAGIVSPIMIIVVSLSIISALIFQSMEIVNAIRWWRFILIIFSSILGVYGIFIGFILLSINLVDTNIFEKDYLYPFSPIDLEEQKDGFIKVADKGKKLRNKVLTENKVRGKIK